MKMKNNNVFKKGKWCPLFGVLPRFEDEPPNSIKNRLIDIIYEGREFWGIGEPEGYPESCPKEYPFPQNCAPGKESFADLCKRAPQESKIKWNWGISGPEVRSARVICWRRWIDFSQNADINPSQDEMSYLELRAGTIAGIEIKIKGARLLALLAISYAASALDDIINRHKDEDSPFVLRSLSEAQALIARANSKQMDGAYARIDKYEEKDKAKSRAYSKKARIRHEKNRPWIQERNEYINKKAKALKEKLAKRGDSRLKNRIAKIIAAKISAKNSQKDPDYKDYKWKPIRSRTIRAIIDI